MADPWSSVLLEQRWVKAACLPVDGDCGWQLLMEGWTCLPCSSGKWHEGVNEVLCVFTNLSLSCHLPFRGTYPPQAALSHLIKLMIYVPKPSFARILPGSILYQSCKSVDRLYKQSKNSKNFCLSKSVKTSRLFLGSFFFFMSRKSKILIFYVVLQNEVVIFTHDFTPAFLYLVETPGKYCMFTKHHRNTVWRWNKTE